MNQIECAFTIDRWQPAETAGAAGRAVLTKTYRGPLEGTAVADFLGLQNEVGAAYVAQETVTGRLKGREGSFVLHHGAAGGPGLSDRQWAFVVPGSGTGALAGLRGEGHVEHELLVLDYEIVEE